MSRHTPETAAVQAARRGRARAVAALAALLVLAPLPACRRQTVPTGGSSEATAARYHCPMHPSYVSQRPGDCPICGMRLVPVAGPDPARPGDSPAGPAPTGRAPLTLSPERVQLLGVRSVELRAGPLGHTLRTVGRVTTDERRLLHVHTKFEGYVERLYVDYTGKRVQRGERLLSIYSPELVATQEEYLLARRAHTELGRSRVPGVAQSGADLLAAARQRLLLWDIQPQDVAALEQSGRVMRNLDLHAEHGGYVVQKNVFHGMRVTPADTLFDIADLSRLWVLADVYEADLAAVRLGMRAELSVPYLPGRVWHGEVTSIAPTVDEKTRTVKVRVELPNEDEALKPDMFGDVRLSSVVGHGLSVPDDAVLRSGEQDLVFLDRGAGRFEPRVVRLGPPVEGGLQVLAGLSAGDRVVVAANFLLDSESSLKAALENFSASARPAAGASAAPAPPAHGAGRH